MDANADQLSIDTPELVPIALPVAGIGSRFVALLIDMLIWLAAVALLTLLSWWLRPAVAAFSKISAQWQAAVYVFVLFVLNWGYFTLFEAFWGGRTPGKRLFGIRVIQRSGRSIGLLESMARNLLRFVDQIPFCYAVGAIAIFVTRQHQRLGDLVAGTLVVREQAQETPLWAAGALPEVAAAAGPDGLARDSGACPAFPPTAVARLTADDLMVIESFFARRLDLPEATRHDLARRLADGVLSRMGLASGPELAPEAILERAAYQVRELGRLQEPEGGG
ncbi:MAG: RDD family protein [Acidobacteriota bacterium]|nr:RDD family protein [Acidobacteriota bacterium]